jgi:hypothetical protein
MADLVALLQRCEDDTLEFLGYGAAQRLGHWRNYAGSQEALVEYIQRLLWGEHCQNGKRLDDQGGLSLERIVLDHCPELFEDSDKQQARRTLGLE